MEYKFTENWSEDSHPVWKDIFEFVQDKKGTVIRDVLEVGCYEGRSTVWVCENVLSKTVGEKSYTVIDTFGGSLSESGMKNTRDRMMTNMSSIRDNFEHNISGFDDIHFRVYQDFSQYVLPKLVTHDNHYDFIYIDASHRSDDTFVDGYFAYKMLRPGGVIIFDDYAWKDPSDEHKSISPKTGIDFFAMMYDREVEPLVTGYQVGLIKK